MEFGGAQFWKVWTFSPKEWMANGGIPGEGNVTISEKNSVGLEISPCVLHWTNPLNHLLFTSLCWSHTSVWLFTVCLHKVSSDLEWNLRWGGSRYSTFFLPHLDPLPFPPAETGSGEWGDAIMATDIIGFWIQGRRASEAPFPMFDLFQDFSSTPPTPGLFISASVSSLTARSGFWLYI